MALSGSESSSLRNPESRPPATLSTEVKANASQFNLFQAEVDIHPETLSMLRESLIYRTLIAKYKVDPNFMDGACYWSEVQKWVSDNTTEAIIDDPANCPPALIYLAFHLPDPYVGEKPTKPYYELMNLSAIKDEWKQLGASIQMHQSSDASVQLTQKVGRPSGGLLIMAAELLIELKFRQKTTANDDIIRTLLLIAAGFDHTPGSLRPKAYFLLGEIELGAYQDSKKVKHLLYAFDFFVSYLKFLPYKTKLALRDDTIAQDIVSWQSRHPAGHALMFWIGNFNLEIYNYRLYRIRDYDSNASEEDRIDTSIAIRTAVKKVKHLQELYSVLHDCILPNYLPSQSPNGQFIPEDDQPLIPETLLRNAVIPLMSPKFNNEMLCNPNTYSVYLKITTDCLLLFRKLNRLTNGDLANATVDRDGTLTFFPDDERTWEISQVSTINPTLLAINTLRATPNFSKDTIVALMEARHALCMINEILTSAARNKKAMNALKEKYERKYKAMEHFKESAEILMEVAVAENLNTHKKKYIAALKMYKLGEDNLSKEPTTVSPQHQLPPLSSGEFKAIAGRLRRGSSSLDKTVDDFLTHYHNKYKDKKYEKFFKCIVTTHNLSPTPEDIIREALKETKSSIILLFNHKHQNKRAKLLLDQYEIDVSEPPKTPKTFKSLHAEVLFEAYKNVYEERRQSVTLHTTQHTSPQMAS